MVKKIQRTRLFRGFSSVNATTPVTEIMDIALIKQDLLNHFHTIKGERVMRPNYGSIIWDMLFEPFDDLVRESIVSDVQAIISQEPRVQLLDLNIFEYEQGLRIDVDLSYKPFDVVDTFSIDFDRRNGSSTLRDDTSF
jgi:phage baseplate assembly protein W